MRRAVEMSVIVGMAAALLMPAAFGATQSSASAALGLSSNKERGVVSVMTEPALADGRLLIKIVAFNRKNEPASFSDANVKVSTVTGKAVALVPLEQLVREAKKEAGRPSTAGVNDHDPSLYSHPGVQTNGAGGAGEPELGGYSGANNPTAGVVNPHTRASSRSALSEEQLAERIAALNAGILQTLTVPPASAAGGQVVTEKLKFSRKEARALHLVVEFNGEQHEFDFETPR